MNEDQINENIKQDQDSSAREARRQELMDMFNPDRMKQSLAGNLMLCGDWDFVPGANDSHVSEKEVSKMKEFFRKYLILFLLVWDGHSDEPDPEDYFRGDMDLHELITRIDFYRDHQDGLDSVRSVSELEDFCRDHNLVNMYGNRR